MDHNAGLGFLYCLPWIWLISFKNTTDVNLRKISLCLQRRWNNWMDISVIPRALSVGSTYRVCNPEPEKTSSILLLQWKHLNGLIDHHPDGTKSTPCLWGWRCMDLTIPNIKLSIAITRLKITGDPCWNHNEEASSCKARKARPLRRWAEETCSILLHHE